MQRWPNIAQTVIQKNDFSQDIVKNIQTLIQELPNGKIRLLQDTNAPDIKDWESYLQPYLGKAWIEIPWYFAEAYFYRRILEAADYFHSHFDPFASQKKKGLEEAIATLKNTHFNNNLNSEKLQSLLYRNLWGNQADLSLKPSKTHDSQQANTEHILVDDTSLVVDKLAVSQPRLDFVVDNAGSELLSDFYLADFLLRSNRVGTLYFHLKPHPTFVSDATIEDCDRTLTTLTTHSNPDLSSLGERIKEAIATHKLILKADKFWTSPLVFWQMPNSLQKELSQSNLIFLKGDANYRRLLGDCHWNFTTSFADITCYFPASFVTLRTLKSEIVAGLTQEQINYLNNSDPEWLVNGQWGVIQSST
ncbi:MAG: damage-control phosphatase ARMT1 family protein [Halothece sp.]